MLSSTWVEKFKLKNNLLGARSRRGSHAPDDAEGLSALASSSHSPSGTSAISPSGLGSPPPVELHSTQSHESPKHESPESHLNFGSRHAPFHSQSTTSLNSAFTDTAPSSFSPGPLSPTSPFLNPDSGAAPSPFVPPQTVIPPLTARLILPATISASGSSQRLRNQTFPLLDQYMSGAGSADALTLKYATVIVDSPMEESSDPLVNIDEAVLLEERPRTVIPAETMRPPPLPGYILVRERNRDGTSTSSIQPSTSPEEGRRALEVVMSFIEQQPSGFLDFKESMCLGKLMEKLKPVHRCDLGLGLGATLQCIGTSSGGYSRCA